MSIPDNEAVVPGARDITITSPVNGGLKGPCQAARRSS